MSKTFVLGLLCGTLLLVGGSTAASRLKPRLQEKEAPAYNRAQELADSTAVVAGVMTSKQRVHAGLYPGYLEIGGQTLAEAMAASPGDDITFTQDVGFAGLPLGHDVPEVFLGQLTKDSDAIVRGRVTSKEAQLTEDGAFIFTDYGIRVREVLKQNTAAPIDRDDAIVLTRAGGKVQLDGIVVIAHDGSVLPLKANGNDELLYLKYVPETGAYRSTDHWGAMELVGDTPIPLTGKPYPPKLRHMKTGPFLGVVRATIAATK
jgi:hypothetical protein